jgi:DNA-directed RNA polymerase beta subunit
MAKFIVQFFKSEEIENVEVSYAFKLLLEELQGLHIHTDLK